MSNLLASAEPSGSLFVAFSHYVLLLLHRLFFKMTEPAVRFYVAEVALGIHDLHKMGYVHR